MTETTLGRRDALKATGGIALALGGLSGGVSAGDGWFSGVSNYDGVVDKTGESEVTVEVGAEANGGAYGFGPAAVRVDPGTTVVWEWTGKGGSHNVVAEDGAFESDMVGEAGHTFERTFEEAGVTKYYCMPHKAMGMKGAVLVGDASLGGSGTSAGAGDSGASGETVPESWFSDVSNYDGVVDKTGESEVTVEVGAEANGGAYGFGPAAVRVDPGTTVVWKWTGKGGSHNVVAEDGAFESDMVGEAGHTFERTFEEAGATAYYCMPHKAMGMKGAVLVGDAASVAAGASTESGGDGGGGEGTAASDAASPTPAAGDAEGDGMMTKAVMVGLAMAILSPLGLLFGQSLAED